MLLSYHLSTLSFIFFFHDTATTEIYTLSLHDALPISLGLMTTPGTAIFRSRFAVKAAASWSVKISRMAAARDRKSTRLNSSHVEISYAVFCLKKKKKKNKRNEKKKEIKRRERRKERYT